MSMHDDIEQQFRKQLELLNGAEWISPASLATQVQQHFANSDIEPHIKYTSLEHLKQIARGVLRGKYEADATEVVQKEMFEGQLQDRYPIKVEKGEEPKYKLLNALTDEEVKWNIYLLRKSAIARQNHANALEAWNENRSKNAA